jgi:phosphoglucosamine mutase
MPVFPQVMVNVRVARRHDPMQSEPIVAAVRRVESQLGSNGRVVLRASGTEPLIRVMVEGRDEAEVRKLANELAEVVQRVS